MKDQSNAQAAKAEFVPIQISAVLLQKLIEKTDAVEALKEQQQALHDVFWDEVCEAYGLDREQDWTLDKTYLTSGTVMLKPKPKDDCCGICKGELGGDMPDSLKAMLALALSRKGSKPESVSVSEMDLNPDKETPVAVATE